MNTIPSEDFLEEKKDHCTILSENKRSLSFFPKSANGINSPYFLEDKEKLIP